MKKIFSILILIALFSIKSFSQNVFDRKVNFEYIKLPLKPVKASIVNYQTTLVLEYKDEMKARKETFTKSVSDTEKKYENDVADYDKRVKEAGVRYAQDMAAYKINQKVQPDAKEPVLTLPLKPEKSILKDNFYYPKEFNQENLSNYINLQGFSKAPNNALIATVLLKGFQYTEPKLKTNEITKTKDGVVTKEIEYSYELSYRHAMGLKVETSENGLLFNEYFESLSAYINYKTQKYKSEAELVQSFNKQTFLSSVDDRIFADNLKFINDILNNNFGYTKVGSQEEIFLVQGKKFSYSDYQQAFEATTLGLGQLSSDINRTVASQNLNSALMIWEKALTESQPGNKKARINGNVTTATLFNLALVSIYANEFGRAEIYLNKIFASDASKKEQRRVERIKVFLKDQLARNEAYKRR